MAGMYQKTLLEEQKKKVPYTGPMMAPGEGVLAPQLPVTSELDQPASVPAQEPVQPVQVEQPIVQTQQPVVQPVKPVAMPGIGEQIAGMKLEAQAAQEKAKADNEVISNLSAKQIADAQDVEVKRDAFEKDQSAKLDSYNKELEKLNNTPIKSPDWWGSKTTGEKIMAGVGLFFAALGNQGQMQRALASIDKQIDDDIKLQEKNLGEQKEGVKAKIGILDKMRSIYGDVESSKMAAKKAAYDGLARQLEINANNANSKMAQGQLMQGVAKAKQESARYNDLLAQKQQELSLKRAELEAKQVKDANTLTPGQEAADKEFGKNQEAIEKGLDESRSKISTLKSVIDELGSGSDSISGPLAGSLGILNQKGYKIKDKMKTFSLGAVKDIFPGATSDFEVQSALEMAYNPLLEEADNKAKMVEILKVINSAYKRNQAKLAHFKKRGSLQGYDDNNYQTFKDELLSITGKPTKDRIAELEAKARGR